MKIFTATTLALAASPILLAVLTSVASAHDERAVSYFATPTGGAYGHGSVSQVTGDQRAVIYDFCPDEASGCLDGAAPLTAVFEYEGSVIGVTGEGGEGNHGRGGPGGVVFRLRPMSSGVWSAGVISLCSYYFDCDHFGFPTMVRSPESGVLEIVNCMRDCKKGERSRFKMGDGTGATWTKLQTWGGDGQ